MVEVVTVEGPLDAKRLRWIADLYGQADPKFRRPEILEHLYTKSPAGPGLHAFAMDDGAPVGHCSVVPTRGRLGGDELRCGKLEALFLEPPYRARNTRDRPVVRRLLDGLYESSDERGFELVHALATPQIGRIIEFTPLHGVGRRSLVALSAAQGPRLALAAAQRAARGLAARIAGSLEYDLRAPTPGDADLVEAPSPPPGRWAVLPADAWEWYRSSPLVRVLELMGRQGSRALVQLPGSPREPLRLVAWRSNEPGLRPALRLAAAAGRVARAAGAATLRFQPWESEAGDGDLERACRLAGFFRRDDLTTVWVRTRSELARPDAVVSTPGLYLGF